MQAFAMSIVSGIGFGGGVLIVAWVAKAMHVF